jgi:hypothetical protein
MKQPTRPSLLALSLMAFMTTGAFCSPQSANKVNVGATTQTIAIGDKAAGGDPQLFGTWKRDGFIPAGYWLFWERDTDSHHSEMIITTDGEGIWSDEGDIDLYVREDHPPTFDDFDFISDEAYDSDEEIVINNETDPQMHKDNWWIGIYAYEDTYYEIKVKTYSDPLFVEGWTVPGAKLNFSGLGTVTAEYDGYYTYDFIPYNWTGTITPSKANYSFDPPERSYLRLRFNLTEQNFTAIAPPLRLTGWTNYAYTPLTFRNADGSILAEITADVHGFYSYYNVPYEWTGSVRPTQPGVLFDPLQREYANLTESLDHQVFEATILALGLVSGSVLDAGTGGPFPGAKVQLRRNDGASFTKDTDAMGEFLFSNTPPGEYFLWVSGKYHDAVRWPRSGYFTLIPGSSVTVLNITLSPMHTASRHWMLYR